MKTTGTGSRSSPIAIDDSEDEVLQVLVGGGPSVSISPTTTDQRDKFSENGILNDDSKGGHYNPSHEGKQAQKRKRVSNENGPVASSSQQKLESPDHAPPPAVSKKRKKRKKADRPVVERPLTVTYTPEFIDQPARQPQTWVNGANYIIPEPAAPQALPLWGAFGAPFNKPMNPFPYNAKPYSPKLPSSSSWVASMAMAVETPVPDGWKSCPSASACPDPPQRLGHDKQYFFEPVPPVPPAASPPFPAAPAPQPPLPLPVQPIGMKPDHEPSSKHGLFMIIPGTSRGSDEASSSKGTYIPNPARTLVMEQLPKSHRTQDFVNNWSKSACGAYPVFLCIDSHGAKALVEFATAELARKAWSSPRLGAELVGVKTHHLKGRPREDLIKVWWYRVDGIGANAGVGEIEEGEIEGDAAEKEIEVPVKKETKKERKARLNRERLAKKASKPPNTLQQQQQTSRPDAVVSEAPLVKMEAISSPQPLALPPNPNTYSPVEQSTGYSYYPIIPQALPHPLPQHHFAPVHIPPLPPPRASLVPQSTLEFQWRSKHELPKKPTRETIVNAPAARQVHTASVISSRSPSPAQRHFEPADAVHPPSSAPSLPLYEDMDVDVDMDLESPTGRRAAFDDLSSVSSIRNHAHPANLPSPPLTTMSVSGAISDSMMPMTTTSHLDAPLKPTAPLGNAQETFTSRSLHEPTPSYPAPPPSTTMSSLPMSASGTLPLEPRAMKNAPKGPSYAKRSLIARQKELEERIARSKMELGIVTTSRPSTTDAKPLTPITESPVDENEESNKQAMEERLRSLVLLSQKNKSKSSLTSLPSTDPPAPLPISPTAAIPTSVVPPAGATTELPTFISPASSSQTPTFSLEDLAVSFITETIETYKATPTPPAPAGPANVPTSLSQTSNSVAVMKLELAAKQRRLEAQIAESKILMAKLSKARTKHERDTILAAMREQSRSAFMSEDAKLSTPSAMTPTSSQEPVQMAPKLKLQLFANTGDTNSVLSSKKWPGTHEHAGVLIVSDDEEDDESDGDD
ncbi:hypothetical protein H0H87_006611 [Tephrocybe sp. NHM501043]|nr:hypothetical protein H0H87_006611 [Tephrocybe sp. NHM501043]